MDRGTLRCRGMGEGRSRVSRVRVGDRVRVRVTGRVMDMVWV